MAADDHSSSVERMAGAIVYCIIAGELVYYLVKSHTSYRFPLRRIGPGEKIDETVVRTIKDEFGNVPFDVVNPSQFQCVLSYPEWDPLLQRSSTHHAHFLLARVTCDDHHFLPDGRNGRWVTLQEAFQILEKSPFAEPLHQATRVTQSGEE